VAYFLRQHYYISKGNLGEYLGKYNPFNIQVKFYIINRRRRGGIKKGILFISPNYYLFIFIIFKFLLFA